MQSSSFWRAKQVPKHARYREHLGWEAETVMDECHAKSFEEGNNDSAAPSDNRKKKTLTSSVLFLAFPTHCVQKYTKNTVHKLRPRWVIRSNWLGDTALRNLSGLHYKHKWWYSTNLRYVLIQFMLNPTYDTYSVQWNVHNTSNINLADVLAESFAFIWVFLRVLEEKCQLTHAGYVEEIHEGLTNLDGVC